MDSQYSKDIIKYDDYFMNLLEVKGSFIHKLIYRNAVRESKEFYKAYVIKCNEYNTYMDFFTPLSWHLVCCGIKYKKVLKYFSEIRDGIIEYLKSSFGKCES